MLFFFTFLKDFYQLSSNVDPYYYHSSKFCPTNWNQVILVWYIVVHTPQEIVAIDPFSWLTLSLLVSH